jgi:hypothetical protein
MSEESIQATLKMKTILNEKLIEDTLNNAVKKGLITVANRAIVSTLPLTIKDAKGQSPSRALKKTAINKLKARIKGDIMGDGKVGSGIASATVGGDGDAMIDIKGGGYMPFVVQAKTKKGKGKKKKKNKEPLTPRFLVTNAQLLLNHIMNNTRKKGSNKPMVRFIKKGANYCWTTLDTVNNVVKLLQARAGNFLSGWKNLASTVGNKKLASLLQGGNHDGEGDAELEIKKNSIHLSASNEAVPPTKQGYASMVESHIQRWANEAIRNELKYAFGKLQGRKVQKGWYGK